MTFSADYGLLSPSWAGTAVAHATSDGAFTQAMLDVEAAWVSVLAGAGITSTEDEEAVLTAANVELYDLEDLARRGQDGANALIPLLGDLRGEIAKNFDGTSVVHKGATSQDIIDTALMLLAARSGAIILADLMRAADGLNALATAHRRQLCVARSLTQHALPTTFGLRAANWLSGLIEAGQRLQAALESLPLQWGGAVGTLASLTDSFLRHDDDAALPGAEAAAHYGADAAEVAATVRGLVAELATSLGLRTAIPWHTNRLPITQLAAALGDVIAACGHVANDVLMLSRPEIGEVSEPHAAGKGGSSAMPQKQNPVLSVLIRSAALAAPQHVGQLYLSAGTADDERPDGSWHAEWSSLRELIRLAGGSVDKLAQLSNGLEVHPRAMYRNAALSGDLLVSERVMSRLSSIIEGGKKRIQELVRQSITEHRPLSELLREAIPAERFSTEELHRIFDPANYLGQADSLIDSVSDRLAEWKES
ncbi:lyase family protein [Neomicrococcus lactis]|uniref:3-carboxy-cis,cis-muconate cycloisomerase n=1 Tax=Neomicrococcus lactis TaxID=732241 RepID=A0A7W8YCP4_9MICC|nr:lyase family protein [Neomicrococcus lactis]MBB5599145.1 3-carboxy-cis,cis-muconate cycloisomerase [Neomicrococcus lactis]